MKRKVTVIAAAAVLLLASASVYGAPSPDENTGYSKTAQYDVGNIDGSKVRAYDAAGNSVSITVSPVPDSKYFIDEELEDELAALAEDGGLVDLPVLEDEVVVHSVLALVNIELDDNDISSYPVTVTIPVSEVEEGKQIVVFRYVDGEWVPIDDAEVGDGYVEVSLDSSGPIAVMLFETMESEFFEDTELEDPDDTEPDDTEKPGGGDDNPPGGTESNPPGAADIPNPGSGKQPSSGGSGAAPATVRPTAGGVVASSTLAPQTGDTWYLYLFTGLLVLSVTGLGVTLVIYKREKKRT